MLPDLHTAYADARRRSRLALLHLGAKRAFVGLLALGALQAIIGYAQMFTGIDLPSFQMGGFWDPEQRVYGTLGHPLLFALFISITLVACAYVLARGLLRAQQATLVTVYALGVMPVLVFAHERAVWAAFLLSATGAVLYANRARA